MATASINFAAFLGVSILVIVTPGQDTALTIRNTLFGGQGSGVATAAGVSTGQLTWTVATSAGLAALLVASEPVFTVLKWAGAAYLAFLGLQALRAALFGLPSARAASPNPSPARGEGSGWRQSRGKAQPVRTPIGSPPAASFVMLPLGPTSQTPGAAGRAGLGPTPNRGRLPPVVRPSDDLACGPYSFSRTGRCVTGRV